MPVNITIVVDQEGLPDGSIEIEFAEDDFKIIELMPPTEREKLHSLKVNSRAADGELNRRLARREQLINMLSAKMARKIVEETENKIRPPAPGHVQRRTENPAA